MVSVLVVEDDDAHRRMLTLGLERRGLSVVPASDGRTARSIVESMVVDLIVLDLGLPDVEGVDLCAQLRLWPGRPIIVVSGRDDEAQIIEAFTRGADDYVVKPVALDILAARIDVQLRHAARHADDPSNDVLTAGDVQLDPVGRVATIGGVDAELNFQQFQVLAALMRQPGQLVTYDRLLQVLGRGSDDGGLQALRTAVSRLRSALGGDPRRPVIESERHLGYRLRPPAKPG